MRDPEIVDFFDHLEGLADTFVKNEREMGKLPQPEFFAQGGLNEPRRVFKASNALFSLGGAHEARNVYFRETEIARDLHSIDR